MKQVWECEYCGRRSDGRIEMEMHEKDCDWNPANKRCMSCQLQKNESRACEKHGYSHRQQFGERGHCADWVAIKEK